MRTARCRARPRGRYCPRPGSPTSGRCCGEALFGHGGAEEWRGGGRSPPVRVGRRAPRPAEGDGASGARVRGGGRSHGLSAEPRSPLPAEPEHWDGCGRGAGAGPERAYGE